MTPLTDLLRRVEGATGPDRQIDRAVMATFYRWEGRHIGARCWDDEHDVCCKDAKHIDNVWVDPITDKWVTTDIDGFEFTASVDRALALVERVLPGVKWSTGIYTQRGHAFLHLIPDQDDTGCISAHGATPALALLAALLAALIARSGSSQSSVPARC